VRRSVVRTVAAALVATGAVSGCAYLDVKQREWIFRAERSAVEATRGSAADGMEELWIPVGDGHGGTADRLHAWWLPAERPDAPSLLYLHGARWDLVRNAFRIARLHRMGFNVLAIDYRGFGQSSGTLPSEKHTYEDAAIAWNWLKAREPDPSRRFVYGHSLGGAVAIDLVARHNDAAGLIVESTFTSIRDMAELTWARWLPLSIVLTQRYDSLAKVADVKVPTLFVHGKADRFVPATMTERLFKQATGPKRLLLVENGSHSNVTLVGFDAYQRAVRDLVAAGGRGGKDSSASATLADRPVAAGPAAEPDKGPTVPN
jgi:fermentation-respiration switch protein FrsA (DUF1100 family)